MSRIITYSKAPTFIKVAVPFTWGSQEFWAIRSPGGEMFYLHDGSTVLLSEVQLLRQPNFLYAKGLDIK